MTTIAIEERAAIRDGIARLLSEIALACDLEVTADNASFGLPEVKRGILAGAGGAFRPVQQLPGKFAMKMLLTGDPMTAARAHDPGQ
jgi:crotonobetainyl-CoA hydratase